MRSLPFFALGTVLPAAFGVIETGELALGDKYSVSVGTGLTYNITVKDAAGATIVNNVALLAGASNDTTSAIGGDTSDIAATVDMISSSAVRVRIRSGSLGFTGATFASKQSARHYGVWGYPFNGSLRNDNLHFDLKGLQLNTGINYLSARSPFFISDERYAVYTDTMAMGSYAFTEDKYVRFTFNTTELTYYILLPQQTNDMKSLITQYAQLSDTTALWSPTAYGPMFWHDDRQRTGGWPSGIDTSQGFVLDTKDKLAENKIRASAIMADRPYGTGTEGWGNWDFDTTKWPDAEAMIAELADAGIDFQVWVANRAVPDSKLYEQADESGWLFKEMATEEDPSIAVNLSIPEAYNYMKESMDFFPNLGVKGYKIDRSDENEMPVWEQNIQTYLYHKLLYEGQAAKFGGSENNETAGFYNFARAVNDRSRKYTGVWNADPQSNVEGLLYSVRSGVRAGLLGFPMWGSDCGGYVRRADQLRPTEEVWARWAWFAAFSPVYECMLYDGTVPWYDYSPQLSEVLSITAELHVQLIPYIQSYMFQSTFDGLPVIRALLLETPDDDSKDVWTADETYFFGKELMVAPIVERGKKGVYFPKGWKYLEFFDKTEVIEGGQSVTITRDVYSTPVYIREGSIIPRGDLYRFNKLWDDYWQPWLDIDVYPSYAVPRNTFEYYDQGNARKVDLVLETTADSKNICLTYGALGQSSGTVNIYVKGGPQTFELNQNGATECVEGVDTLFD